MDEEIVKLRERATALETGRTDDQRAVELVAANLSEKVDNLKTLVKVVSGVLMFLIVLVSVVVGIATFLRGH
jgi:hypothetical protein